MLLIYLNTIPEFLEKYYLFSECRQYQYCIHLIILVWRLSSAVGFLLGYFSRLVLPKFGGWIWGDEFLLIRLPAYLMNDVLKFWAWRLYLLTRQLLCVFSEKGTGLQPKAAMHSHTTQFFDIKIHFISLGKISSKKIRRNYSSVETTFPIALKHLKCRLLGSFQMCSEQFLCKFGGNRLFLSNKWNTRV